MAHVFEHSIRFSLSLSNVTLTRPEQTARVPIYTKKCLLHVVFCMWDDFSFFSVQTRKWTMNEHLIVLFKNEKDWKMSVWVVAACIWLSKYWIWAKRTHQRLRLIFVSTPVPSGAVGTPWNAHSGASLNQLLYYIKCACFSSLLLLFWLSLVFANEIRKKATTKQQTRVFMCLAPIFFHSISVRVDVTIVAW